MLGSQNAFWKLLRKRSHKNPLHPGLGMVATLNIHSGVETTLPANMHTHARTCTHTHIVEVTKVLFMEKVVLLTHTCKGLVAT